MDVTIIGAGVSGLTTGICLAEAGHDVTIRTAAPPERTTSVAAGAIWGPVFVGPKDRVLGWAEHSLAVLAKLAEEPGTGVRLASGKEITRTDPDDLPYWSHLLPSMRRCEPSELPPGFAGGWHYTAPLATMPVYLDYLRTRFTQAGGTLELTEVGSLAVAPVVVNCSGVAARDLVPDPSVYPVRGQVVIAENPGIEEFLIDRDETPPHTVYMLPHGDTILLGGTLEEGAEDLTPNPIISERIVANAAALEPRLHGVRILGYRVGLRPRRPEVRLEAERLDGTVVWHNYGHGGAGISLSWGCAAEIASRIGD
jgi:D-amino-acid oxidase